jgi:hypothetical protein
MFNAGCAGERACAALVVAVLNAHGITAGLGWLIDMLALSRIRLPSFAHEERPASGLR